MLTTDTVQSFIFLAFAGFIALVSVRAFRRRALSFTLFTLWGLVAGLFVLVPALSILLRERALRAGVSPTGVILGLSVTILVTALFKLSTEATRQRGMFNTLVRRVAEDSIPRVFPHVRSPSQTPTITVVIPAWNEADTIESVVRGCLGVADHCIVVDDGSSDDTAELAGSAGAYVVSHAVNLGVGAALRTGFGIARRTNVDVIVQCDADGQHHFSDIQSLAVALRDRAADLVVGSRFADGGSYTSPQHRSRRAVVRVLAGYASQATGTTITDPTSGFRAMTPQMAEVVSDNIGDHFLSDTFELLVRAGRGRYRVSEVPVRMTHRQGGMPSVRGPHLVAHTVRTFVVVAFHLVAPLPVHPAQSR